MRNEEEGRTVHKLPQIHHMNQTYLAYVLQRDAAAATHGAGGPPPLSAAPAGRGGSGRGLRLPRSRQGAPPLQTQGKHDAASSTHGLIRENGKCG